VFQVEIPAVETLPQVRGDGAKRHVVVVAVPDADPFDVIGPMTVLVEANIFLERSGRADLCYDFEFVTNVPGTVFSANGFRMEVERSCYDIQGEVDTIVFQAIDLAGKCLGDERFLDWVRGIAPTTRRMATACIGTYILAEAGLLDGRRAATHWALGTDFRRRYPEVELDDDPIYIKDGKFYTSAGVTSILDLMLALVEEDFGSELALRVAQGLVMFLRRPATQSQFSQHLAELTTDHRQIRAAVSHVVNNLDGDLTVPGLSRVAAMSPRHFSRVFSREIGVTPGKFVELSRLEAARRYLEQSNLSIDQIARECGYGTRDGMRLAFDRTLGVAPREYRNRFR
jgi:transcriptional regulator GlxA family with amidase domain